MHDQRGFLLRLGQDLYDLLDRTNVTESDNWGLVIRKLGQQRVDNLFTTGPDTTGNNENGWML